MYTSYILDKDELFFLWELCGGDRLLLHEKLQFEDEFSDPEKIAVKLEKSGIIYASNLRTDVERTFGFLVTSMVGANKIEEYEKGTAFYCDKLIVWVKSDVLSPKKCKLVPLQNESEFQLYLKEQEIIY